MLFIFNRSSFKTSRPKSILLHDSSSHPIKSMLCFTLCRISFFFWPNAKEGADMFIGLFTADSITSAIKLFLIILSFAV